MKKETIPSPNLEKMLKDGFTELGVEISPHCRLYERENMRIIYDYQMDRVVLIYKVEVKK